MTTIIPPAYVTESEELYDQSVNPQNTKRLVAFIRPYIGWLILSAALMLIASAASVAGPYFVKIAIDSGLDAGNAVLLRYTLLAFLGVSVIQWVGTYYRVNLMSWIGQSVIYDLRKMLFAHLQDLSLGFYSRYSVGRGHHAGYQRCGDPAGLHDLGVAGHRPGCFHPGFDHCGDAIHGCTPGTAHFQRPAGHGTHHLPLPEPIPCGLSQSTCRHLVGKLGTGRERQRRARFVQAFSRQKQNYEHFRDYVNRYHLERATFTARISSVFSPSVDLLGAIATGLVIWLGGTAVLGEKITAGVLVAFILYIDRFFDPIRDLSRRYDALQSTMIGWERIMGLLDIPVEVQDAQNAGELPSLQGEVRLEHVSFHYSDDPAPILTDIDLHIRPGETVALVGETGAGKTTLVKLLSRFHDPTSGCIRADGYDLRTVTQASLRKQMGVVLQDPFLFNGTVRENIRFGRLDATDAEVEAAAQAVGAHDFIIHLRNGYETSVEEGGAMLSVGQRQLLSFARALLADPRILILDEATSSVDTQTEQIIQAALRRLLKGRTSFVIAHRLSTITNADRIVVVHDGKIIEQGTHAELLEKQGMYYNLYRTGFQE